MSDNTIDALRRVMISLDRADLLNLAEHFQNNGEDGKPFALPASIKMPSFSAKLSPDHAISGGVLSSRPANKGAFINSSGHLGRLSYKGFSAKPSLQQILCSAADEKERRLRVGKLVKQNDFYEEVTTATSTAQLLAKVVPSEAEK